MNEIVIKSESRELTVAESRMLEAAEQDINKGGEMVARALQEIRDKRLYRAEFDTFEDYCRERLNRGREWARQQIMHIEVIGNIAETVATIGSQTPTPRATREIADLPPKQQREVIQKVKSTGKKPTAANVKAAREEVAPKEDIRTDGKISGGTKFEPAEIERSDAAKVANGSLVLDELGRAVPESHREAFDVSPAMLALSRKLDGIRREAEELAATDGGSAISRTDVKDLSQKLKWSISQARYWTSCNRCDGKGCDRCKGRGWLTYSQRGQLSAEDKAALGLEGDE